MLMFIKDWTLPIAMMVGVLSYFAFKDLEALEPLLPAARWVSSHFPPWLIFFMLLFTFTKIHPKDLWPRKVHLWLLLVQVAGSVGVYLLLHPFNEVVAQSAMICIICPTATAAAIITEKLGGKVDALITYVIEINLVVSVFVPAVFPLIEPHEGLTFFQAFLTILKRVVPLLVMPLVAAWFLRFCLPAVHRWLYEHRGAAFYLWAFSLILVMAQTTKSLVESPYSLGVELSIAFVGLVTCVLQFVIGKRIGSRYGDRISAGQGLGQKNTVLAIWMAYTYLNPVTAVAPGCYVVWQNIINSWQLYRKRKHADLK
ncbi:MAG: transporter [Bacteroidetes bacterium]|uniref:Transporter n=1 Tax=Candidatus Merdivivens pullistercoris TaxID=2840873 RepID=A0A9D9I495_9BACT|nr:transporter [Candidatus Merdivivens pullistercoris]